MIQDIFPHVFSNQYVINCNIQENDYIFHFKGNSLLLKQNSEGFEIPMMKDGQHLAQAGETIFLFSLNDVNCFLLFDCPEIVGNDLRYEEINFFRTLPQKEIAWAGIVAYQLMNWYTQNKFCGKCGSLASPKVDERAVICHNCQTIVYPKISPAIIVAIICEDKILLASGANFRVGFYSLIAGYADIGESLEDAVVREVKEEVGLEVRNIRYYKSQPWPYSGSMMIGYVAEADYNQPISIDEKEITEAAWFSRSCLPNHPTTLSIAGEMIEKFERGEL